MHHGHSETKSHDRSRCESHCVCQSHVHHTMQTACGGLSCSAESHCKQQYDDGDMSSSQRTSVGVAANHSCRVDPDTQLSSDTSEESVNRLAEQLKHCAVDSVEVNQVTYNDGQSVDAQNQLSCNVPTDELTARAVSSPVCRCRQAEFVALYLLYNLGSLDALRLGMEWKHLLRSVT